jgi:hypothetical protein
MRLREVPKSKDKNKEKSVRGTSGSLLSCEAQEMTHMMCEADV